MCEVFGASQQALPPPQARAAWAALWTALSQHPAAVISTQQQSAGASGPRKCPQRPGSGLGVVSASVFYLEKNSRFLQWCQSKEKREHSGVPLLTSYPTCPVLAGRPRPVSCVWCLCPHTGRPLGRPSGGFCVARLQRAGRTRAPVTFSWDLSWSLSFGLDVSTDASAESSEMSVLKKTALPSRRQLFPSSQPRFGFGVLMADRGVPRCHVGTVQPGLEAAVAPARWQRCCRISTDDLCF